MTPAELATIEARVPTYPVGAQADLIDLVAALREAQRDLLAAAANIRRFAAEAKLLVAERQAEIDRLRAELRRYAGVPVPP